MTRTTLDGEAVRRGPDGRWEARERSVMAAILGRDDERRMRAGAGGRRLGDDRRAVTPSGARGDALSGHLVGARPLRAGRDAVGEHLADRWRFGARGDAVGEHLVVPRPLRAGRDAVGEQLGAPSVGPRRDVRPRRRGEQAARHSPRSVRPGRRGEPAARHYPRGVRPGRRGELVERSASARCAARATAPTPPQYGRRRQIPRCPSVQRPKTLRSPTRSGPSWSRRGEV